MGRRYWWAWLIVSLVGLLATPVLLVFAMLEFIGGDVGRSEADPGLAVLILVVDAVWVFVPLVLAWRARKAPSPTA